MSPNHETDRVAIQNWNWKSMLINISSNIYPHLLHRRDRQRMSLGRVQNVHYCRLIVPTKKPFRLTILQWNLLLADLLPLSLLLPLPPPHAAISESFSSSSFSSFVSCIQQLLNQQLQQPDWWQISFFWHQLAFPIALSRGADNKHVILAERRRRFLFLAFQGCAAAAAVATD